MSKNPFILIIDDHPLVREGMEQMLQSEGFEVKTAESGEIAVKMVTRLPSPDLVISDIRMPGADGFETLSRLRRIHPKLKVLFLAGMPLKIEVEKARELGAAGYLPKSIPWRDLVAKINQVIGGGGFVCETMPESEKGILTRREMDVLKYLNLGKTREEIAIILGLSSETIKSHVKSIKVKLDVPSATGAVGRAYELGILRA